MLLAVISDTHMDRPAPRLEAAWERHLESADALLHCGDITGFATWQYLCQHPAFHAARGNCDLDARLDGELESVVRLELGGLAVGLTHGWGPRSQVPERVARELGPDCDLVCYGHTHAPFHGRVEGHLLLNPGSLGEQGSLALVEIGPGGSLDVRFERVA